MSAPTTNILGTGNVKKLLFRLSIPTILAQLINMMDLNIGDQDSFSKMALGWVTPYVVTDSCTVTIKPNESSGDCIVLADHWNGTAFDEYLVLDLQTPTGVNESDASASYNTRPMYYSYPGIRMLHVLIVVRQR